MAALAERACDTHDVGRRAPRAEFRGHELHVGINVVKEMFVSGAKIVQAGFPVRCLEKTMLWAFPVAGKSYVAFAAHARE